MRFYEGQPVVCVNDTVSTQIARMFPGMTWPVRGQRYVIRRYVRAGAPHLPAVLLVEIKNRRVRYLDGRVDEAGFWDERFAPITDIGDLEKIAKEVDQWMGEPEQVDEEETEDA
jgi:hypothetical protein